MAIRRIASYTPRAKSNVVGDIRTRIPHVARRKRASAPGKTKSTPRIRLGRAPRKPKAWGPNVETESRTYNAVDLLKTKNDNEISNAPIWLSVPTLRVRPAVRFLRTPKQETDGTPKKKGRNRSNRINRINRTNRGNKNKRRHRGNPRNGSDRRNGTTRTKSTTENAEGAKDTESFVLSNLLSREPRNPPSCPT